MNPHDHFDADIQVDQWRPTATVRVQVDEAFVDLEPVEVELLVALLEANKSAFEWQRKQRDEQETRPVIR